jgi:hypothetical protein
MQKSQCVEVEKNLKKSNEINKVYESMLEEEIEILNEKKKYYVKLDEEKKYNLKMEAEVQNIKLKNDSLEHELLLVNKELNSKCEQLKDCLLA